MSKSFLNAALVLVCVATSSSARAQSLADVAKRTEEQRKAQTGPSILITSESDFREVRLTDDLVGRFASARGTLSGLYVREPAVYEAVRAGAQNVKRFRDFVAVLEQQPKVVESLKIFEFDAASFVLTEVTIRRSLSRAFDEDWGAESRERENTSFARSHEHLARDFYSRRRSDAGHWFWPEAAAYW